MSQLTINRVQPKAVINRNIYGQFSEHLGRCVYGGLFVGERSEIPNCRGMRCDIIEALRSIKMPVLRWPGGCFADEYHWLDGVGPRETRKRMINTHWGGVIEDNSFGTHEFMELCDQIGCEPYIAGNVGSGSVREMSEWMEYLTFDGVSPMAKLREKNGRKKPWRVKYFGIGNENWGCGGNMRPAYYADLYRHYQTYVRNYSGNKVYKVACGPNADDYAWTDTVMKIAGDYMDALSLHYYTFPTGLWDDKGNATGFSKKEFYATLRRALRIEELIENHSHIMRRYDPAGRVGLIVDEWGTWYNVEPGTNPGFLYQQNTMRDALVAALSLNIFNRHADCVVMANLAQVVNVLQSLILTEGKRMLLTPTYHVFELYKGHMDAVLLESFVDCQSVGEKENTVPKLDVSVSQNREGNIHITLANLSATDPEPVFCTMQLDRHRTIRARILHGAMDAHNTFDAPDTVRIEPFADICADENGFRFMMPACSVMEIVL